MSPDSLQAPDDPEAAAIKAQEAALVRAAVAKLPPELQDVLRGVMRGESVSRSKRDRAFAAMRTALRGAL